MKMMHKLTILVCIPLFAFFAQSYRQMAVVNTERLMADEMRSSAGFLRICSDLINELQKERGFSALFVNNGCTLSEVESQRAATDPKLQAYADLHGKLSPSAEEISQQLSRLRVQVADKQDAAGVRKNYSGIISSLLKLQVSATTRDSSAEILRHFYSLVLLESAKESLGQLRAAASAILAAKKPVSQAEFLTLIDIRATVTANLKSRLLHLEPESIAILDQLQSGSDWEQINLVFSQIIENAATGNFVTRADEFFPLVTRAIDSIGQIVKLELNAAEKETIELSTAAGSNLGYSIILVLLATLLSALASVRLANSILGPVSRVVQLAEALSIGDLSKRLSIGSQDEIGRMATALDRMSDQFEEKARLAERIADGDLTVEFEAASSQDILGLALQKMVSGLNDLIGSIREGISLLSTMSTQISEASQSLSEGASKSAASLEEISASMIEINSQTQSTAKHTSAALDIASKTRKSAESGTTKMTDLTNAVNSISDSGKQITKIIKVIEEIAFQTNLLSLNAAVEAARAGRHGKGFAVVAEEVQKLAVRSSVAAKETANLIARSMSNIESGSSIASNTSETLKEIEGGSVKTADLLAEIATASDEQAQGISQITIGMNQIDQVTQQNSAHAEQTATAAEELAQQVEQLKSTVSRFRARAGNHQTQNLHLSTGGRASDPLKWTEEMLTGIAKIDNQHHKLVSLANDLHHALKDGKAQDYMKKILDELVDYTKNHFFHEEQMLIQTRYPDYDSHHKAHQKLIGQLTDIYDGFKNHRGCIGVETFLFLKDWLVNHIMRTDKKYSAHLKKHGL